METKKKPIQWKRGLFIVGMIIVPILHFLIFYLYVNLDSILMAFQKLEGGELKPSFGNFTLFFEQMKDPESEIVESLKNTLVFFGTNLLLILPATLFIAYFIYKKIFGYKFFRVIFFIPSILSAVVLTIVYEDFVGIQGPIAKWIQTAQGLEKTPELLGVPRYALKTILGYTIWTGFGTNLILLGGAMNRIPEETIDAGKIDGVGMLRELFQIILPMVWPTLTTVIVFAFVGIFTSSGPILLFTEGKHDTYTISYWIFAQVYGGASSQYASAVGLAFTIIALPIVFGVKILMEHIQEATEY